MTGNFATSRVGSPAQVGRPPSYCARRRSATARPCQRRQDGGRLHPNRDLSGEFRWMCGQCDEPRRNARLFAMCYRFALRIATLSFCMFLATHTSQALDPMDVFPPTTFSVTLRLPPPAGDAFTKTLRIPDPNIANCAVNKTYQYNYTPAYPDCFRLNPLIPPPVSWNVAASVGVRVGGREWHSVACMLRDISQANATQICSGAMQGVATAF